MNRLMMASAALVFGAHALSAQITTYIAPPRPLPPSPEAVATADSARRDSVQVATMTNMKAWVDSAAGVTVPASVGDSAAMANDPGRPDLTTPTTPVTTFSDGTVAPATASDLPTLALLGVVGLVVGAGLLATRPRG
jgi:hypothetical protein